MPDIPIVQDSAQLQTGTGRQQVQSTPNAFGAQQARGLAQVGQAFGQVADVAAQKADEFDHATAQDLDNQLSTRIRERLYNSNDGYLSTQRGINALKGQGQVEADLDGYATELSNAPHLSPRARAMFTQVARERVAGALGDVSVHAARENQSYQNDVTEAAVNESMDNAVAAYSDPATVETNIQTALGQLRTAGQRNGWGPDVLADRERQLRSDITQRVIVSLAESDPDAAQAFFDRVRPTLTAQDAGQLQTTMHAIQAQARERVTGAIWQAYANGQDPRQLPEWQAFTSNPLYGQEHERFNQYRRERALQAQSNALTNRESALVGDTLEATGAVNPRALVLMTDYATGRLSVGNAMPRHARPDMTPEEFQSQTGYTPAQARQMFSAMHPNDLLRVLTRRDGQTDNQAVDRAYNAVRAVVEPLAQSTGINIQGARNVQRAAQLHAFIYRAASDYVAATGQQPDQPTIDSIAHQALLQVQTGNWLGQHRGPLFERTQYANIPVSDRNAIEANFRAHGVQPTPDMVERRYTEYLLAQQQSQQQ